MDSKAAIKARLQNLSPEQRSALVQKLAGMRQQEEYRQADDQPYPLSRAQRRLWTLSQLGAEASAAYNISAVFYFEQGLHAQCLQQAWRRLLARHEVLRSAFRQDGELLLQVPRAAETWHMTRQPLLPGLEPQAQLLQLAATEAARPFDLQQDWLLRVTFCEPDTAQAPRPAGVIIVMHHIVCDGLSIASMIRELAQFYGEELRRSAAPRVAASAPAALPPSQSQLQYRDYVLQEARSDTGKASAYWKQVFATAPESLDALLDRPRAPFKDFAGACVSLALPPADLAAFEALCRAQRATLYMGLVALVQLLLARCANADEVVLGTPVAGRPSAQFEAVVGPFVNTIALRQRIDRSQTFGELLQQVRRTVLGGFEHQELAFDALVGELALASDPSRSPLYDAMIGFNTADELALDFGDSRGRPLRIPIAYSKMDLTFHFEKQGDGSLLLDLEYASGLLLESSAARLCKAWRLLMLAVAKQPELPVGEFALQTEPECRQLLEQVNATATRYPQASSLVAEFRKTVAAFPAAIAVHAGDVQLSYQTLDAESDRLASLLQQHPAYVRGSCVALMLEKDARVLVVILAILKSRCTYVPLAANTPLERVSQVLTAGAVALVFAEARQVAMLGGLDVAVLDTDALLVESSALAAQAGATGLPPLEGDMTPGTLEPAYLMFTSGSTGMPKGTLIEQRAVLRLVCNTDYHQVQANERVLLTGSLAFDAATFEIWGPLLNGGCVCIPAGTSLLEVHEFGALVEHYRVDTAFLTTGLFNQLVDNSTAAFGRVRTVLTGGEKISVEHVRKLLQAHPALNLLHVYGPTENTTFSTWHRIVANDLDAPSIPIGRPIANSRIYLLDQQLRPVPVGVPGEIYCGGDGVARGYLAQPESERKDRVPAFVPDPFGGSGARMYRTGDLAKWNTKHELVFLGRNDRQVKIRGFRVELAEVEYHLRTLDGIADAYVAARGDAGSSELVAWLVVPAGVSYTVVALREALKQSLPAYMLPAKIVCLQSLPLNASGKVDARALPLPEDAGTQSQPAVELLGKVEQDLALLFAKVLGLGAGAAQLVSRDANFFSLGGDSIRAIQLVSLARASGYHFTLRDIFATEDLAGLAAIAQPEAPAAAAASLRAGPLSPTQHWWLDQPGMPASHFNLSSVFRVDAELDLAALRAALDALVELYPALRLRLDTATRQQLISDKGHYVLRVAREDEPRQQCWQELQQAIDLDAGVLLAVGVARAAAATFVAVVVHHLAADEVSGRLFAENLERLYQGMLAAQRGAPATAAHAPIGEGLAALNWATQLQALVQRGALDADLPYWTAAVARGKQILQRQHGLFADAAAKRGTAEALLPEAETALLLQLGKSHLRMTMQELLLAAFIRAWQTALDTSDCLLWLEGHGRESLAGLPDCSATLGWFTSLSPFAYLAADRQDPDLYRKVKDAVRALPAKGFTYLPLRYYKDQDASAALALRPQLSFNYLGEMKAEPEQWLRPAGEPAGEDHGSAVTEPFKLDVLARVVDGNCELFLRGEAPEANVPLARLAAAWRAELAELALRLQALAAGQAPDMKLLCLSDSLVPFASLAELDALLAALQVSPASIEEILPLTGMQAGMWLHCSRQSAGYQDQVCLRLRQPLDEARFAASVQALVAQTQALRTGFAQTPGGELLQLVFRQRQAAYQFVDASAWGGEVEAKLAQLRSDLRGGARDLLRDSLFSLTLVRIDAALFELIVDFHHMVVDGWTSALLLQRLETLYFDRADAGKGQAPAGMRRYFEWFGRQSQVEARQYWQGLLGDYQGRSDVPPQLPRVPAMEARPVFVERRIGAALHASLLAWCRQHGLTVNAVVQTLWGLFLGRLTAADDVVFGATVSGRDIDLAGVDNIAGMLINTLPLRIRPEAGMTFEELVQHTARQFTASMGFGHLPLAEILTLTPARQALISHALVFENYPGASDTGARWCWETREIFDPMHFEFGLIVAPLDKDLGFRFVADGNLYLPERLQKLGAELCALLATLLDQGLAALPAPALASGWSLSANFTADSLAGLLQYHEYIGGGSGAVTLLPYDQSVQELINPASRLRRLPAHNHVVLWRPALDAAGDVNQAAAYEQLTQLAAALASYSAACKGSRLFVVPCPWFSFEPALYREFTAYLKGALAGLGNAELVPLETLAAEYSLQQACFPPALVFGDIPYSEEFFAALANRLARQRDLHARRPVKVYVVDADDTLWGGIVGEEGAEGVRLDPAHLYLQEKLLKARAAGALVCLATKNNEEDVRAVFEQRAMPLRWNHLTRVCAGWRPKSESVLALAEELSLGLDSFVFIDDSPLECEQVRNACPGVITIQLPPVAARDAFLKHAWLLDARAATREDASRAQMYSEELQRSAARKATGSYADFLASLDICIEMQPLLPADLVRTAQLSQRTNQFNTSGIRYTEAELESLQASGTSVRCVRVKDKYGEYGLVGSVLLRCAPAAWTIAGFMLSCRVLGRGVEHAILRELAGEAAAAGAQELRIDYVKLPRNAPALQFLQSLRRVEPALGANAAACQFRLAVADAAHWQPGGDDSALAKATERDEAGAETRQVAAVNLQAGLCAARASAYHGHVAATLDSGAAIMRALHQLGVIHTVPAAAPGAARTPPATATETTLAGYFAELLGHAAVCREDSFHALGGHSLKAMMLLSRIAVRYGIALDFRDLQANPTLAMLAELVDAAVSAGGDGAKENLPALVALPQAETYAASPGQSRLWMLEHIRTDGRSPFHMHATLAVEGSIDRPALDQALRVLCLRHESLRTHFLEDASGAIRQVIAPIAAVDTRVHWRAAPLDDAAVAAFAEHHSGLPFDLGSAPLLRIAAAPLATGGDLLCITLHHIISDGWSMGVLARELTTLYRDFCAGLQPEPAPAQLQFRDFAAWQLAWLDAEAGRSALHFWREHFATSVEPLQLPGYAPRPALLRSEGASIEADIPAQVWAGFNARLGRMGLSVFTGLFASLQLVLARLSGQSNFCIGTAVAGRQYPQLEALIGFFANVLPLRTTLDPGHSAESFLQAAAAEVNACLSHQGLPFDRIVAALDLERDPGRAPLFDVLLVLQDTPQESLFFGKHEAQLRPLASSTSQYDLTLSAFAAADGSLKLIAEYNSSIFTAANTGLVLRCLQHVIVALTNAGAERLAELPWLAPEDIAAVAAFEGRELASKPATLPDIVRAAAASGAYIGDSAGQWSYPQLLVEMERIADLVAAALPGYAAARKPGKHQLHVGVIGQRCKRSIAALLGVMEAGAVYVPLDLNNPAERLHAIVEDGDIDLLLSTDVAGAALASELQQKHAGLLHLRYGDPAPGAAVRARAADTAAIAYMIFTSGSTGKPKGVQISHASFAAMIHEQVPAFDVQPSDVCGQFAALSFDASLSEIFLALVAGAALEVAPDEVRSDIASFMTWLDAEAITVLTLPPAFLRALNCRELGALRVLITAGEAAIAEDLRHYAHTMRVLNAYGPTETSVCASVYEVDTAHDWSFGVPIGLPLPGVLLSVRDSAGARVPVGVAGELYIGGMTVGRGYYGAPELSAQKFTQLADASAATRWYRSGDLVRWRPDGLLEYVGRTDRQIKVRGYRIEPGEIEQVARSVGGVEDAIALVHPVLGLWLYCAVAAPRDASGALLQAAVLAELGKTLPRYMVPGGVELLAAFPLSTAGKIDRDALLALAVAPQEIFEEPATPAEAALAQAWQRALQLQRVGRRDDFFALGGDSIKALVVVSTLRTLGFGCALKDFFASSRLCELALVLRPCEPPALASQVFSGRFPLLPIQHWFLHSRERGPAQHFHIVAELGLAANLDESLLRQSLALLVRHHASLRACFYRLDAGWVQEIRERLDVDAHISVYRCAASPDASDRAAVEALACRPFDLDGGALFRVVLVQDAAGRIASIVMAMHHLIADWVSLRIVVADLNELAAALRGDAAGLAGYLPPPQLLPQLAQQRSLQHAASALTDAAYRKASEVMQAWPEVWGCHRELHTMHLRISPDELVELQQGLRQRSAGEPTAFRLHELMLAAVVCELGAFLAVEELPVLVESHGRDDSLDLSRQVAWLTRARLVNLQCAAFNGRDALEQARQVLQGASGHVDVFSSVSATKPLRGSLPALLSFNYLGDFGASEASQDLFSLTDTVFEQAMSPDSPIDVPLHIEFYLLNRALEIQFSWSAKLAEPERMRACCQSLHKRLLELLAEETNLKPNDKKKEIS